jgi:hypothetical protein
LLTIEARRGPFPVSIETGGPRVSVAVVGEGADPDGSSKEPLQVRVAGWAAAEATSAARDDRVVKDVLNIHGSKKGIQKFAAWLARLEHSRWCLGSPATVAVAKSYVIGAAPTYGSRKIRGCSALPSGERAS